jgi:hypothetical protein
MDEEVLGWCLANGRRLTDEQILIYNSFMSKRGWHDDESDSFIPQMVRQYGLKDDGSILTDFDLIEMDEGRWYPDTWRDAWRYGGGLSKSRLNTAAEIVASQSLLGGRFPFSTSTLHIRDSVSYAPCQF